MNKGALVMLVDPFMLEMKDLLEPTNPESLDYRLKGALILRYRKTCWGQDHPAIQLFWLDGAKAFSNIDELRKELDKTMEAGL